MSGDEGSSAQQNEFYYQGEKWNCMVHYMRSLLQWLAKWFVEGEPEIRYYDTFHKERGLKKEDEPFPSAEYFPFFLAFS